VIEMKKQNHLEKNEIELPNPQPDKNQNQDLNRTDCKVAAGK
jgi:hypothetical protein